MSDIKVLHYLGYSLAAGLFWAATVSLVGYGAGILFDLTPSSFEENVLFIVFGFGGFGLGMGYMIKRFVEKEMGVKGA